MFRNVTLVEVVGVCEPIDDGTLAAISTCEVLGVTVLSKFVVGVIFDEEGAETTHKAEYGVSGVLVKGFVVLKS